MYELTCPVCKHVMHCPFVRVGAVIACQECSKQFDIKERMIKRNRVLMPGAEHALLRVMAVARIQHTDMISNLASTSPSVAEESSRQKMPAELAQMASPLNVDADQLPAGSRSDSGAAGLVPITSRKSWRISWAGSQSRQNVWFWLLLAVVLSGALMLAGILNLCSGHRDRSMKSETAKPREKKIFDAKDRTHVRQGAYREKDRFRTPVVAL